MTRRHDESVKRLQDWIALPSIAAEDLNSREGAEAMARLAAEAGFQKVEILDTDGKPRETIGMPDLLAADRPVG